MLARAILAPDYRPLASIHREGASLVTEAPTQDAQRGHQSNVIGWRTLRYRGDIQANAGLSWNENVF